MVPVLNLSIEFHRISIESENLSVNYLKKSCYKPLRALIKSTFTFTTFCAFLTFYLSLLDVKRICNIPVNFNIFTIKKSQPLPDFRVLL